MSSEDEEEHFVGDEHGLHGDGEVVADLVGGDMQQDGEDASDIDESFPENATADEDESIHTFDGHKDAIFSVSWHPTSNLVASGSADDKVFMWQVGDDTGASTRELSGHTDTVGVLAFSKSGNLLASGGLDGRVGIWETSSGQRRHMLEGPGGAIEWVHWHPKGDVILAGTDEFTVWLWNAQSGACMQVFTGHGGAVTCGQFSPDGRAVVTGGGEGDCSLRVWDPKSGACLHTVQGTQFHSAGITALAMSPDSVTALTGAEDGSACLTNVQSGRLLGTLSGHKDSVEAACMAHMLPFSATASVDGQLLIWDTATLSVRATCQHPEAVVGMELHPTKPLIFTACLDGRLRCWDARDGSCVKEYTGHTEGVQALALNYGGSYAITGSDDKAVRIFATGV